MSMKTSDESATPEGVVDRMCRNGARAMANSMQSLRKQVLAASWVDASKFLPMGPHEVLATDGEGWFIACLQGSEWWLHELDEPCDSEITHWMELPELPEV